MQKKIVIVIKRKKQIMREVSPCYQYILWNCCLMINIATAFLWFNGDLIKAIFNYVEMTSLQLGTRFKD